MRIFIGIILYNILIIFLLIYTFFFSANDVKVQNLKDVSGLALDDALNKLIDYEISIEYVESNKEKETVLYTQPLSNKLVYEKQMITLYVSKGYLKEKYRNLENIMYEDSKEYLNKLVKEYKIELVVTYKNDNMMLDGLIYKQNSETNYIDYNDTLEIVVISNPKTVILPDFTGWNYMELLRYINENDINVILEYVSILYPSNHVVSQSVLPGERVLKNSNPITISLAKEI